MYCKVAAQRWLCSGMLALCSQVKFTEFPHLLIAVVIRARNHRPDDGDSKYVRNVNKLLPDYTLQQSSLYLTAMRT